MNNASEYKKKISLIMKLGIAVLLVFLLIDAVNWHEVWQSMVQMQGRYVALFCFFYIGGIVISAWKWSIIARHIGFEHSHFFYVKTYLAGTFLNNFFPSFMGGDTYRTITIGKKSRRMIDATTTVIIDRMTGLVFYCCMRSLLRLWHKLPMLQLFHCTTVCGIL